MTDDELAECVASGQWRCTLEEVREAAARLLREKRGVIRVDRSEAVAIEAAKDSLVAFSRGAGKFGVDNSTRIR